jgi:rod shape-determining protein MreD
MSSLLITLLLLFGAAVQTLLPPWAFFGSSEWPVLTALLITISLRASRVRLIYAALLAGVLYDAFSPAPLGTSIPFFVLLGLGLYALRDEVFADQLVSYIVLGLLAVLLKTVYFTAVLSASGLRPLQPGLLAVRLGGSLILGALTAPLVYLVFAGLRRAAPAPRRRWPQ